MPNGHKFATPFYCGEKLGTTTFTRNLKDFLQCVPPETHYAQPGVEKVGLMPAKPDARQ
jgi:hypothetical protein